DDHLICLPVRGPAVGKIHPNLSETRAGQAVDRYQVVAAQGVDGKRVDPGLRRGDVGTCRQPLDAGEGAGGLDGHVVAARRAVGEDLVRRTVATTAASTEIDLHLGDVRAREVVDVDEVGASQGTEVDHLDVVEVLGNGGDV